MITTKELFLYFAKYTGRNAALAITNKTESTTDGYSQLVDEIKKLPVDGIIPELKHYVFGVDETSVAQRIDSFDSYYLFVNYGSIQLTSQKSGSILKSMMMAVTVAMPLAVTLNLDQADILLINNKALGYIDTINKSLISNSKHVSWLREYGPGNILPFNAPSLSSSQGWTLTFNINYYE